MGKGRSIVNLTENLTPSLQKLAFNLLFRLSGLYTVQCQELSPIYMKAWADA